jgi:hypothetical protein
MDNIVNSLHAPEGFGIVLVFLAIAVMGAAAITAHEPKKAMVLVPISLLLFGLGLAILFGR